MQSSEGDTGCERVERHPGDAGTDTAAIVPASIMGAAPRADDDQTIDHGVELFVSAVAAGVVVPAIAAQLSLEVRVALSEGWWAVFVATLTWSLAVAAVTVLVTRSALPGYALAGLGALALGVAVLVAGTLGTGYLDLTASPQGGANVLEVLVGFGAAALQTYGLVGVTLGAGVGCWLGYRVGPIVG